METLEQLSEELIPMHFGTDGYYGVKEGDYAIMTSGMLDFIKKTDAIWIMQHLNSDEMVVILKDAIKKTGMLVVKIEGTGDTNTVLTIEDGNYNLIWDGALPEKILPGRFDFWLEPFQDKLVALLPSEH